jgi:hypothetical protein
MSYFIENGVLNVSIEEIAAVDYSTVSDREAWREAALQFWEQLQAVNAENERLLKELDNAEKMAERAADKISRIDIIGQNGNTGEHYEPVMHYGKPVGWEGLCTWGRVEAWLPCEVKADGLYIDEVREPIGLNLSDIKFRELPSVDDPVNNPKHYQFAPGIEAIQVIEAILTTEQFRGYLVGNALKYRLRAGDKGDALQDIAKANWYQAKARGL